MNNIKLGFSWIGLIVFLLPMLINIVYVILPPKNAPTTQQETNKILEIIEQSTRILYMLAIVFLVCKEKVDFTSIWMFVGLMFLTLYYIVWFRYFLGGRDIELLGKPFLFVPMPLAVFPVIYFICSAIWLNNYIAVLFMIIFGIAHNIISYKSF
ncbi:hypothetical protein [Clostridium sp. 1001270J_160509_D11]|uniref:hypothetical protein n=1 Tax=Clostridium sp. 1001270J_160509_D11 TaxID=2787103 RepID=UPI0018AA5E59|nr:hypothetical protein [Clostridium sp. 1001270J_160509_D11]